MFVVIAVVGVVILLVSLLLDDFIDELIPDLPWISGPVIGAFLAAFGVIGWSSETGAETSKGVAAVIGLGGGLALGYGTYRASRALWNMPTDATPTTQSVVGAEARVVTPIRSGGLGEIVVSLAGQPVKLSARAAGDDIKTGTTVVVVAVESDTRVLVQPTDEFWAS